MDDMPRAFADLTAKLEDAHAISVEGQRRDNPLELQRALASHLRMAILAMDSIVAEIKHRLGEAGD